MLKGQEASFQYVIGDLILSGGFVWCQLVDGLLYLRDSDIEVCRHRVWIICIWNVAKICWWWRWEEDFSQCIRFLFVGCCFAFQCGDVHVGGGGVEILVDFPDAVLVCFAYKFLPCVSFAFIHFVVVDSSMLLPIVLIFLSSIFVESSSGSLCLLP